MASFKDFLSQPVESSTSGVSLFEQAWHHGHSTGISAQIKVPALRETKNPDSGKKQHHVAQAYNRGWNSATRKFVEMNEASYQVLAENRELKNLLRDIATLAIGHGTEITVNKETGIGQRAIELLARLEQGD